MVSFPPCKINLGLRILDKREDGYHNLETCFYPVPWTDILEVIKADSFSFTTSGEEIPGSEPGNLCVRAFELLQRDFNLTPAHIHLHKIIPAGAGLGGGSSDAAHTLRLVNEVFQLGLSRTRLMEYAAMLGSDCAFFVQDEPMIGTARGERLSPVSMEALPEYLVLVNPGIHVATADAFAGIKPGIDTLSVAEGLRNKPQSWRKFVVNDFEGTVFEKYPAIRLIKEKLYSLGAVYASMTGSGSTVYGFFEQIPTLNGFFDNSRVWCSWQNEPGESPREIDSK